MRVARAKENGTMIYPTELQERWNASHDRLATAEAAYREACDARHPSRQQVTRATEALEAAKADHYDILDEMRTIEVAAELAANVAEEAAAVAAAMEIINGR